ncbi:MAG: OmpA family protein [Bacteroidales bacterium]|nr:OmpA family protein [Bacteroidales bacterium]
MKKVILFALILLPWLCITGQTIDKSELKEYFLDAEFFFTQEDYVDALYDYMQLYNNGYSENANINYRIGVCHLNIPGQKDKSISFLQYATNNITRRYNSGSFKETRAPVDAWLFLGNAYRVTNQLDKAIEVYNEFKTLTKSSDEIRYADQQIAACQVAMEFMNEPLLVRKSNLGSPVNSSSSNFKAVISGNGTKLVYMNELPFYDAVYFSTFKNNTWTEPINITPQIQSDGDQYASSLSYDGKTLYLSKEGNFDCDIFVSRYENDKWSKSMPVGGNINSKYWESHASISKDGKTLYFTSNRKGGAGSMDIYVSKLGPLGQWNDPVPLDGSINTALNEDTPFITENDSLLYFSSQGHVTMGGYDIQVSKLLPSGNWSEPENLKYPINSTDDDLFYCPWYNGKIGYISLVEEEGLGKEDIYAIQMETDKPYTELLTERIKELTPVIEPEAIALQEEEQPVDTAELAAIEEKTAKTVIPEEDKTIEIQPDEKPVLEDTTETQPAIEPEQAAPSETTEKEIILNPVYFAFDRYQLSETGKKELKNMAEIMSTLSGLTLKLYGYADAIGPAPYNLTLSEKRAISAMEYLISLGIEAKRLTAVGMGETNFAAINKNPDGTDCPEGRKLNRRVECEILGISADKLRIKRPVIPERLKYKN